MTDRDRLEVLEAERELETIRILADHANLSPAALGRIDDALQTIQSVLNARRADAGLQARTAAAA